MVFKPVPGTKVAFCIWETRVKDYAAFTASSTEVDESWKMPGHEQSDTHPVTKVNWNDANAFCAWLTKKELAEGIIKTGQKYRLPTDVEWSVAVGLSQEKGNTPAEKDEMIKDVYPWGNTRQPPKGAGNYWVQLEVDNFKHTSPVGSFQTNAHGIYDLGGNVWEWCADWYDPSAKGFRVMRGGSWYGIYSSSLLSSYRRNFEPDKRLNNIGFRCVLASE